MALDSLYVIEPQSKKYDSAESVKQHVDSIRERKQSITALKLSGNSFGVDACKELSLAMKELDNLKQLHFGDIFTGRLRSEIPLCLTAFVDACLANDNVKANLESIDFSDNAFGPDGLNPLVPLISQCTRLKCIKINNTGLGPQGGNILGTALTSLADSCAKAGVQSQLETIVCGRSRLESGSMKALGDALSKHPSLKQVVFPQDGIRPDGVVELLQKLKLCTKLEILDLQDNTFTEKGAAALAQAVSSWTKLRVLNVGDCMMTSKGTQQLIDQLAKCPDIAAGLVDLNLQYNEINEKTALSLVSVVRLMKNLKSLQLNGNCFSADGPAADGIKSALEEIESQDALGTMSDMEEEDSEDESDEESGDKGEEVDELAAAMSKVEVK
ncbi:hypothetical protein MIR68_009567 [Amoeboaphelidium protococcarum]|nr:hypothetical protein MIR68_009567 [Amoeboaphelidium protococcarum]